MPGGRDVAPVINSLLAAPGFAMRVATRDWHPATHVSFAPNHAGRSAYVDTVRIANPRNATEAVESRLWPAHCVQGTPGAALIPELDAAPARPLGGRLARAPRGLHVRDPHRVFAALDVHPFCA